MSTSEIVLLVSVGVPLLALALGAVWCWRRALGRLAAAQTRTALLVADAKETRAQQEAQTEALTHQVAQRTRKLQEQQQLLNKAVPLVKRLRAERDGYRAEVERLTKIGLREEEISARLEAVTDDAATLAEQLQEQSERAAAAEARADQLVAQIEQVLAQDERVWERPVTGAAFQPLQRRRVPIIAVLNLKGGVGKTTITANLAGYLAAQGRRVLTIDADYQRNLSMMLVPSQERRLLHQAQRTLQHFLKGSDHSLPRLLQVAHAASDFPDLNIVTNSDAQGRLARNGAVLEDIGLEEVEMRLMAEWLFRPDRADLRLLLREPLHALSAEDGYECVLIDCPPRLSTACINALAAADFVLIPVLPDATSAWGVPNLLRTLRRLRERGVVPDLQILGVLPNCVKLYRGAPIAQQRKLLKELPTLCRAGWGEDVYLFETAIREMQAFPVAAGDATATDGPRRLAIEDDVVAALFSQLLQELDTRIEHESQRLATVPT